MKVVLKVSGELLNNIEVLNSLIDNINKLKDSNKIAIVIGGGNYFRGRDHLDMKELNRDTIGMLASVMNSLTLDNYFSDKNIPSIVSTPFTFPNLLEDYSDDDLLRLYEDNIIIFGGGIGKCGVSTDTKCFEVAKLLNADMIIKLTNVDGVYDKDPNKYEDAKLLKNITFDQVLDNKLSVMDLGMIEACKINNIKIKVMNFNNIDNLLSDSEGSIICVEK